MTASSKWTKFGPYYRYQTPDKHTFLLNSGAEEPLLFYIHPQNHSVILRRGEGFGSLSGEGGMSKGELYQALREKMEDAWSKGAFGKMPWQRGIRRLKKEFFDALKNLR